jgi:hypothetical protein
LLAYYTKNWTIMPLRRDVTLEKLQHRGDGRGSGAQVWDAAETFETDGCKIAPFRCTHLIIWSKA